MFANSPSCAFSLWRIKLPHTMALLCAIGAMTGGVVANAQPDRQSFLRAEPLAEIKVQPLAAPQEEAYDYSNPVMMYQPLEEDPLSFYVRTQDGEWQIPTQVDANDPWVRLLVLGPVRPAIVDLAININQQPFRAAREQWIDKLLSEARATFLVRTGEAAAEAAGLSEDAEEQNKNNNKEPSEELKADDSDDAGEAEAIADTSEGQAAEVVTAENSADDEAPNYEGADGEDAAIEAISEDDPQVPLVAAQTRQASSLFNRLINYLAADQSTADREEVRWLLAEWTGGPAQLTLSPAFAWRRADAAPLWHALDSNGDEVLSTEEIGKVSDSLKQADINRDEIISLSELERHGKKHSSKRRTKGYPLVVVIDGQTDWNALRRQLRLAYPELQVSMTSQNLLDRIATGDRSVDTADLTNLVSLTPDLVYRVVFANQNASARLLGVGSTLASGTLANGAVASWQLHSATDQAITVEREETYMELTAAQGEIDEENASGDMQQTQVAIGAVVDGYPLLRLLDHDNNQQLTLRERNSIEGLLKSLDRNQDGQVDRTEVPTAIRLTVTHGPFAHQQLANPTVAERVHGEANESAEVPAWFAGMDRNNDGDLSRREFQGSPSQFSKFDQDGDGLISRKEILAASSKN